MALVYIHLLVALLLCSYFSLCTSLEYTIFPSNSFYSDCNDQHCLTLEEFATTSNSKAGYVSATDIQLLFLPGNHSLSSHLMITDLAFLSLNTTSDTVKTWIICNDSSQFALSNISEVIITEINFVGCLNMMGTDLRYLFVRKCTFFNRNDSISQFRFNKTKAVFKLSMFYVISVAQGLFIPTEDRVAVLISYASSITIETSVIVIQRGSLLLAESESNIDIKNSSLINSTTCENSSAMIQISNGKLLIESTIIAQNTGQMIVYARECTMNISNSSLDNNLGTKCILCSVKSKVYFSNVRLAGNHGNFGVIIYLLKTTTSIESSFIFSKNNGSFLIMNSNVSFSSETLNILFANCTQIHDPTIESLILQAQGTLTAIQSTLRFYGNVVFVDNYSTKSGGAVYFTQCKITVFDNLLIANNRADKSGGGAFLHLATLICHDNCTFVGNTASYSGGGIHAASTVIALQYNYKRQEEFYCLNVAKNEAEFGGGVYLEMNSRLNCVIDGINYYTINFTENKAGTSGGAIFIRDETYSTTCASNSSFVQSIQTECFFQVLYNDIELRQSENRHSISFSKNTAAIGSVLYGGLLDRCSLCTMAEIYNKSLQNTVYHYIDGLKYFLYESANSVDINDINSDGVRVCYCRGDTLIDCRNSTIFHIRKGDNFTIPIVAVDQVNNTVIATIRASLFQENYLGEGQQLHRTNGQCTNLSFSITSPHDSVDLILYADQGPCDDKGLSRHTVKVTFRNCTCEIGFKKSSNANTCECILDERLKDYVMVVEFNSLKRLKNYWINYTFDENDYSYFIHPNCPYDYCKSPENCIFELSEPDGANGQCNFNRTGLLCGQCKQNYSLSMGSSHCLKCPENWPGLVVLNILMGVVLGIILVVLILLFNLTVALGTFNGIIFYANVLLTNKSIFLSYIKPNYRFFAIFIYALNTQVGVERCFFDGLNEYGKTWYSFMFPLYIIFLVIAIIIISKFSTRCANIIGKRNPVAALATLILLSYTYLFRTALNSLSFTILKYSNDKHVVVWVPDASVDYFQGKHIPLFLSALVILILGVSYAFLLFSWQWLHRTPNIMIFRWIRSTKLNLFIVAYHAPYRPKYRYWTGLLLLVRILLNIVLSVNIYGNPKYDLFTTGILTAFVIALKAYLGDKLYKSTVLDYFECICYFNLLSLTLAVFYYLENIEKRIIAVFISIGVTVVMFIGVLVYHIHYTLSRSVAKYNKLCDFILQISKSNRVSQNDDISCAIENSVFSGYTTSVVALSEMNLEGSEQRDRTQEDLNFSKSDEQSGWLSNSSSDLRESLLIN